MEIISLPEILRFLAALLFVLALMGGLALVMKRLGHGHHTLPARQRRLRIVESLPLDSRRKLVLLRRDDREHLVILGANSETVIETGVESKQDEAQQETPVND